MRKTWKRTMTGLVLAGVVTGAALGWNSPGDPPAMIPHADAPALPPSPTLPVLPAVGAGLSTPGAGPAVPMQSLEPVAKPDPSVSLDWSGPPVLKVNAAAEYTLLVKNTSSQPLQKVVVQVKVPKETTVKATTPAAKMVDGVYLWELGTLDPKATQSLKLSMVQAGRGEMSAQAWVTFTGTAGMKVAVREPKLEIRVKAPEKVILGDKYPLEYTVKNVGDFPANHVVVGMTGAATPAPSCDLKPGEQYTLTDTLIANQSGTFSHEVSATGQEGLQAKASATVQVLAPKIDVTLNGPAQCLIGRKGTYTLQIRNSGDVAVTDIVIREHVPATFRVLSAGKDGLVSPEGDRITWTVADLAPGRVREMTFEASGSTAGQFTHSATATGSRGTKSTADCRTTIDGIPALRMEMVDLADPIEKGTDTTYEIKITNTGSKSDADLRLSCTLPAQMKFKSASGPVAHTINPKGEVVFDLIRELAPKTEAVIRVTATATGTGDTRFKAALTSKSLSGAVTKEESTHIYGE